MLFYATMAYCTQAYGHYCDAQSRGSIIMLLFEVLIYTYIPIDNVGLGGCMLITISDSSSVMLIF